MDLELTGSMENCCVQMMKVPEIIVSLNRKTKEIKTTYDFFLEKLEREKYIVPDLMYHKYMSSHYIFLNNYMFEIILV